jgi:hypothetical protein
MPQRSKEWKTHFDAIRKVLHTEWNPIGCGVPEDEYDSYIPSIYQLLRSRADATRLADHLEKIETNSMGLTTNAENDRRVAELLLHIMQ